MFRRIYPTKYQRIEVEEKRLIKNPKTEEEVSKNNQIQEKIKKIKEFFK